MVFGGECYSLVSCGLGVDLCELIEEVWCFFCWCLFYLVIRVFVVLWWWVIRVVRLSFFMVLLIIC